MSFTRIVTAASYLPALVVDNDQLSEIMDTSDEWIYTRTGIKRRHLATDQNTSDLALEVAKKLLANSQLDPADLDLIIVATMSPDAATPSTAAIIQGKLGAKNAAAFDISAACSGFVYALDLADKMLADGQKSLVLGAEVLSKLLDWGDRSTAVLFGDGAGGVLLSKDADQPHFLASQLKTYGDKADELSAGITSPQPFPGQQHDYSCFQMNGRAVYTFATHQVPQSIVETARKAGVELGAIDAFLLHQANARIIKQVAKRLDQPLDKFPVNITECGNTSAASEAILLDECLAKGMVKKGQTIMLAGFGGGLTTGSLLVKL